VIRAITKTGNTHLGIFTPINIDAEIGYSTTGPRDEIFLRIPAPDLDYPLG